MKRVAGYVRVSSARQAEDGLSIDMQIKAIQTYCAAHGFPEPVIYADRGVSAFTDVIAKRPAFRRLLEDAETQAFGVIVITQMDRWARNVVISLEALRRVDQAGVALVSLAESIDYSTPVGKLTLAMLSSIAQYSSDDKAASAKRVHAELRAQGKWDGGSPPYGAKRGEDGKLALDPEKAETLARMLALVATVSYHAAADALNAAGIPPPGSARRYVAGAPRGWWPTSLRNTVKAGVWLLNEPEPWPTRYLAAAGKPSPPPVARSRTIRQLTGLPRCHACGHAVVYSWDHRKDNLRLRCETPGCKLSYGPSWRHEDFVLAAAMALAPRQRVDEASHTDPRAWHDIREQERRFAFLYGSLKISKDDYDAAIADLERQESALVASATPARDLGDVADTLPGLDTLPPERINWALRQLISSIRCEGKDARRIIWRPEAVAAFEGCV